MHVHSVHVHNTDGVSFMLQLQCTLACDCHFFIFFLFTFPQTPLHKAVHGASAMVSNILCMPHIVYIVYSSNYSPPATNDYNVTVCIGTSYNVV